MSPFKVDKENGRLLRTVTLPGGRNVLLRITENDRNNIGVAADSNYRLDPEDENFIKRTITACLRLDEDLGEFYRLTRQHQPFTWIARKKAGRLLRSPSVYEDVVKMICTTNCSWALTEIMVNNLCRLFGNPVDGAGYSFPSPEAIAESSEKFLRKEVKVGYRSSYLLELSQKVARGTLDLEQWRGTDIPTKELFDLVRSLKGIGPYAAGNILKLLGRYDYLGLDSWCRAKFFEIYRNGRRGNDRTVEKFYQKYGKWRGLIFWLDVTREFYEKKFPF